MEYSSRYVLTSIDDIRKVAKSVIVGIESRTALDDEHKYNIMLVINELLVNSFEHAKPCARYPVIVNTNVDGRQLYISVTDGGNGFPHKRVNKNPIDVLYCERGRGLMLVNALCNEIKYNESGNSVEVKMIF